MKRQKLLKNLKCRGSLLALLLTVVASLFTYNSAWADPTAGFFTDAAFKVTFKGGSTAYIEGGSSGVAAKALGTVGTLSIDKWECWTWNKENLGNICNGTLYYKIGSSGTVQSESGDTDWGSYTGGSRNNKHKKDPSSVSLVTASTAPGNYELQIWFKATGNDSGKDGCGTDFYLNNKDDKNNYKVTYTVPGFSPSSASQTDFSCTAGSTQDKTISFTHYGTALAKSDCALSGTDKSSFEVKSISESGVTVTFKPTTSGTKKATLTITKDGKTCTITLQGEASAAGDAPTVLIADAPSVSGSVGTLFGYLKFTGCQNVTDYGFIWSTTKADIDKATPTGEKVKSTTPNAETTPIAVGDEGTEFALMGYKFITTENKIYYKAYATNKQGTSYSDEYRELAITGCEKPATPGAIDGNATACRYTEQTYSITAVAGATDYEWTVPEGWTITSGQGTNEITATPGETAVSGDVKVRSHNDCGYSDGYSTLEVTVKGINVTVEGSGASTTPWVYFNFTANTDAEQVEWVWEYSGTLADETLTVFETNGKTAKLKSGAPVSDYDKYTIKAKTNDSGCVVESLGYNVYVNAAPAEICN